jgi:hypothetical protein
MNGMTSLEHNDIVIIIPVTELLRFFKGATPPNLPALNIFSELITQLPKSLIVYRIDND